MSRTIFTGMLGLALAFAFGCGSKPSPEPTVVVNPEPAPNPGPAVAAAAVYEMDVTRHAIPARPVGGPVGGVEVTPAVLVEGDYLVFRTTRPGTEQIEREVLLKLRGSGQPLPVGKRVVRPETPAGPEVPELFVGLPGKQFAGHANGYAMTLELEPRKAGKVAGKIYLCLPDEEKTFLAGTFVATAPRLPTEPPGAEDVPFINGSVTVVGAAPGAVLVTGYAAHPKTDVFPLGSAQVTLGESITAESTHDKPRITTLMAGDGKNMPSRYEHSKLTPGRYIVFAALRDGPAVWKWVDVTPYTTATADLTIDATRTGGLEVTAPLEAVGMIQLAPADDPVRTPMSDSLFTGLALMLQLEKPIVLRKALFKNLAPGRYEVRTNRQIRVVEIVAGKTMELDFDAKPLPVKPEPAPEPKPKG
jgi:hypothetical protein